MADVEADYQLVKILGRGAFGEAVLYRRLEDNSLVVWKEILLVDASARQRHQAMQEASLLSLLSHPNIVAYYNDFMDGATLLIEMEYANAGTLNRKIYTGLAKEDLFAERWILWMFYQLVSAVDYIHERSIIHRDIKSLNIFLTKTGLCKLGDFGLARSLSSSGQQAVTGNVGTMAYMSPEIYKGETYNEGSDVWAVGCVLYEMVSRRLPFAANEIGRLAVEIVESTPKELSSRYSSGLRNLCKKLLSKDPAKRPRMSEVLSSAPLNQLKEEFRPEVAKLSRGPSKGGRKSSVVTRESHPVVTSKSSEVFVWGGGRHVPQQIEALTNATAAMQVSSGLRHFVALTVEREVFTWAIPSGNGKMLGQLGHGDIAVYRSPRRVASLCGQTITQIACGDEFTVCLTEEGRVYAFGNKYWGCLGNGGDVETDSFEPTPTLISFFSADSEATRVRRIAAGATFVFAVTVSGDVYSWGNGDMGQLGLGSEDCHSTPQKVKLPPRTHVRRVVCGTDNTFLIMQSGRVLACGSNENNKSCLDQSVGPRRASLCTGEPAITTVHMQQDFQPVKALRRYRIVDIAAGSSHSGAVDVFGHIFAFGENSNGQLGLGNCRPHKGAKRVAGSLLGKEITHAACGDGFTIVATSDQQVYSWGRGDHGQLCSSNSATASSSSSSSQRTGTALPRPVFSALHQVSSLCCKHWHGIMIAEKILSKRQLSGASSVSSPMGGSVADDGFGTADSGHGKSELGDTLTGCALGDSEVVPDWLAEVLDESVIPMPTKGVTSMSQRGSESVKLPPSARVLSASFDGGVTPIGPSDYRRSSRGSTGAAAVNVQRHSQSRSAVSTPSSSASSSSSSIQRAGSPGRKAVLSVEPPPFSSSPGPVSAIDRSSGLGSPHHRCHSSSPVTSTSPTAGGSGISPGQRSRSPASNSPLSRSSSAGKAHCISMPDDLECMTEVEKLRRQVTELQHERDMWKREAESLRGDRKQLLHEIDIKENKVTDLQRMNKRLRRAHKEIESHFKVWKKECATALAGLALPAGNSEARKGSVSGGEARSVGAPVFRPKSPKASRRLQVADVQIVNPDVSLSSGSYSPGRRPITATVHNRTGTGTGTGAVTVTGTGGGSGKSVRSVSSPVISPWHKPPDNEPSHSPQKSRTPKHSAR